MELQATSGSLLDIENFKYISLIVFDLWGVEIGSRCVDIHTGRCVALFSLNYADPLQFLMQI